MVKKQMTVGYLSLPIKSDQTTAFKTVAAATFKVNSLLRFHSELKTRFPLCVVYLHLTGTSWIYSVYPPNYLPGNAPYCHKVTYQFAFVVTTLVWVALGLIFFCGCCFGMLICCRTVCARRHLIPNRGSFYGAISESAGDV